MSFFDSTKNRVLAGILVGVLIFSVAFGQLGGNSFTKGDLTNGQGAEGGSEDGTAVEGVSVEDNLGEGAEARETECKNTDNAQALELITSLNELTDELNSKDSSPGESELLETIKVLGNGVFTILASIDENDCLTDLNEVNFEEYLSGGVRNIAVDNLPELAELLNDAISKINDSCENCELKILNSITVDFEELLVKKESKKECSALEFYEDLLAAHDHLEDVLVEEEKLDKVVLKELLKDVKITSVDLDDLDFERDVEKLSKEIVEKMERLSTINSEECEGLVMEIPETIILRKATSTNEADVVEKLMNGAEDRTDAGATTPSSQADCPANSIFDDDEEECFCPIVDDYIDTDEACTEESDPLADTQKIATETPDEDDRVNEEEDSFLFCPDGSLTFDLEDCKDEDDNEDLELDLDEEEEEEEEEDDEDDNEDWKGLLASAENSLPTSSSTSNSSSNENTSTLLSNTHASILEAETVQGSTGAGVALLLILGMSSVGLAVLNYRKW